MIPGVREVSYNATSGLADVGFPLTPIISLQRPSEA